MSKAEEKAKEYAELRYCQHCRLKDNCNYKKSCNDYNDSIKIFELGYMQAKTDLSTENAKLKEALRSIIRESEELIPKIEKVNYDHGACLYIDDLETLITKAEQLINKE